MGKVDVIIILIVASGRVNFMDTFVADQSGINSLGGFAYQIKVFVFYMLSISENMQVEFETVDDVSVRKLIPETIDDNEDKFRNLVISTSGIKAIQVKRTLITADTAKQIILNWILLEGSESIVTNYILFTDNSYGNKDNIFDVTAENLYSEVLNTTKSSRATIAKVKKKYKKDKQGFVNIYNEVKGKYSFVSTDKIDKEIDERCKILFKKAGVNGVTYYKRIEELLKHITFEVMEHINDKKSYSISYEEMITYAEDICSRFTDQYMLPIYSEFKKLNKIDFNDLKIAKSREYKQLLACKMPQNMIETHLQYGSYYQNICYGYLELNKTGKIRDIETTTFENFEYVKFILQKKGNDSPWQRLDEIKKQPNSYADSDQIKYGSGIYLTREDEKEHQISWEDEDNAEP